jgi:hypothetical protein
MLEKKRYKISDILQPISIYLIVLGIIFSENRTVCYLLIGMGVLLTIISLIIRKKAKNNLKAI